MGLASRAHDNSPWPPEAGGKTWQECTAHAAGLKLGSSTPASDNDNTADSSSLQGPALATSIGADWRPTGSNGVSTQYSKHNQNATELVHLISGGIPLAVMPFVRAIRHGLQEAYGKPTTASKIMLCVMTDITPAGPHAKSVSFARSGFATQADSCRMVEEAAQAYLAGELGSTQSCIRMVSRISHIEKENLVRQLSEPSASGQRLSTQDARWDAGCAFFSTIKHSHHEALQQAYSAYPGIDWAGAQELYGLLRKLDPMKIAAASPDLDRPSTLQGMPGAHVQYFVSVLDKQAQQRQIASQIVPKLLTWDKFLSIHGKSARSLEQLIGKEAVEDGFQPCRQMLQAQMPQESERAQLRKLMLHFWQQFEGMSPSEVVLLAKAISHCCEGNLLYGLAQQPDSFTPSKPPPQHFWLSTAAKSGSKSADQISPPCETCWVHFMHDLRAMYS